MTDCSNADKISEQFEKPVLLRLADVKPEPVKWLWPKRIARGKLSLLAGDPGLGKSLLTMDMVARLSRGGLWPDETEIAEPAGSVLLTAEDDPADTIRPRLDAANADVERVTLLQAVRVQSGKGKKSRDRSFNLAMDLPHLESAIQQTSNCQLVIIDPISAYCGETDSHKNAEVRALLSPLSELAQRTGIAIVAVSHLNKANGTNAVYRTMGSLAFAAAARAVFAVTKDQTDPSCRLFLPIKNNIGNDREGLKYTVKSSTGGQPFLSWFEGSVTISADEALNPAKGVQRNGKLMEAGRWLVDALANGSRSSTELIDEAKESGIAERTLFRAANDLKIKKSKIGFGADSVWNWELPTKSTEDDQCPF